MNAERWLVSYADFITLLFAFFVVMFASSQVDKRKIAVMAASFDSYVSGGTQATRGPYPAAGTKKQGGAAGQGLTMAELQPAQERLTEVLRAEIAAGKIEVSLQPRGLVLSLKESPFFAPGDDTVAPAAAPIFEKVTQALLRTPGQIRLEGHTDNTPIHSRKFPSNWQLSTARSIAVMKLLTGEFDFPPERLAVAGYGEYQPLEPNDSEEGRRKNRRVDIVILTQAAAAMAPR